MEKFDEQTSPSVGVHHLHLAFRHFYDSDSAKRNGSDKGASPYHKLHAKPLVNSAKHLPK